MNIAGLLLVASLPFRAKAHVGEPLEPHDLFTAQAWVFDPWVVVPLVSAAFLYARGTRMGRGIRGFEAGCYWTGWCILVVALISPVHAAGEVLFSVHMLQHELLMLSAAPLLVLGRPMVPYVWALPFPWRRRVARPLLSRGFQIPWQWMSHPLQAFWIHGAAVWIWHVPRFFQATLESNLNHALQHLSFLLTALLFWWSLLRDPRSRGNYGISALYVFATALHTSILGALLTFASTAWYPLYSRGTAAWGLTPLEDQQLGGVIMWVPGGMLYAVAGLALMAAWLRESGRNPSHRKSSPEKDPAAIALVTPPSA